MSTIPWPNKWSTQLMTFLWKMDQESWLFDLSFSVCPDVHHTHILATFSAWRNEPFSRKEIMIRRQVLHAHIYLTSKANWLNFETKICKQGRYIIIWFPQSSQNFWILKCSNLFLLIPLRAMSKNMRDRWLKFKLL